ncbi:MAG: copper homeostasis protein CutC, partial [Gemmatimonadota bacterium]
MPRSRGTGITESVELGLPVKRRPVPPKGGTTDGDLELLIEACVDTVQSAINAQAGGADRIELCDNLADAGTTPSHGTMVAALAALDIPVFPIIRLRGGGFVYSAAELAVMRLDVVHAREVGCDGVVVGALTDHGDVDVNAVMILKEAAGDLPITFHRAFDVCADPVIALETLIDLGIHRILTSGQRETAWQGREIIAALRRQAEGRIVIMAGGGVDESNAGDLVRETGVSEIHVRGTMPWREVMNFHEEPVPFRRNLSEDETVRFVTDPVRIGAIRA